MGKVFLVGSREIPWRGERMRAVAARRTVKLVLDQVDDQRVETLQPTVFQVSISVLPCYSRDQRPRRIAGQEHRPIILIHEITVIGTYLHGEGWRLRQSCR